MHGRGRLVTSTFSPSRLRVAWPGYTRASDELPRGTHNAEVSPVEAVIDDITPDPCTSADTSADQSVFEEIQP